MVDPLYDKKFTCLYCEDKFTSKKIKSNKIIVNRKDPDFCAYYYGDNPLFYEISVCPHCGFAFSENFSSLQAEEKDILKKGYIDRVGKLELCGERNLQEALTSFKMALLCASLIDESKYTIAGLCMRIAWLNRYQNNKSEEEKYLAKAAALYEEAYVVSDERETVNSKNKILYIIGEIHGRLGHYQETKKWFNMLLSQRTIEPALKTLVRDQWAEYKMALAGS